MAVTRSSGGPGRGAFTEEWRGAQFLDAAREQIGDGVQTLAVGILDDLKRTLHEESGESRRLAFSDVSVEGTHRTIRAGTATDYAVYEEFLHPQIRLVIDRWAPRLTQTIAAARKAA